MLPAVITVMSLVGLSTPLPYYAQYPGGATAVNPLVGVPKDKAHPATGRILLTTVALQYRPTVFDSVRGWLDPDIDLFPEEQVLGDITPEQFQEQNMESIDTSKDVAITVALRRLGFTVNQTGTGALVEAVVEGMPAQAFLRPGDVIVGAAGQPVGLVEDVQNAVAARSPGEILQLDVHDPNGMARSVGVPLVPCPEDTACPKGGTAVMGVQLRTQDEKFEMPFEVTINSEDIGGPSAGLAFALTVIDLLTPGELTGGRNIAVTGEIGLDGTVGAIGGVRQKAAAVSDAGVEFFLVPRANLKDAQSNAGENLRVIPVTDLESALAALAELGGDVSPLGPPR